MRVDIEPKKDELEIILAKLTDWGSLTVRTMKYTGPLNKDKLLKQFELALEDLGFV